MARTNPVQFIQQTRAEVAKIVWPARREVILTIRTGLNTVFGLF
jgi:preprotein translocase subunit SecE